MKCLTSIRFADAVVLLRRRAGVSQTVLASQLGVTSSAISRVESGLTTPAADTVDRLAEALSAAPDERNWLAALAAHSRLEREVRRECHHWPGATSVIDCLRLQLASINAHDERRSAPI